MRAKLCLVVLSVIGLSGCASSRAQAFATCNRHIVQAPRQLSYVEAEEYLRVCMDGEGYVPKGDEPGCKSYRTDQTCYVPKRWFARMVLKAETELF